jgi:ERF superfamily
MDVALALPDDNGNNIDNLIAMAVQSQASVENLERLLAMRRELKAEYALAQYNKAMAAFQAACPIIKKSKVVTTSDGRVGYRYAPLDAIISQVKALVQQHGFSYTIDVEEAANGQLTSLCIVNHVDGHSKVSRYPVVLSDGTRLMSPTQVTAAALTFAKRYAFCDAFGIMTGDDDNDARKMDTVEVTPISWDTIATIESLMDDTGVQYEPIYKRYKVTSLTALTSVQGQDCVARLTRVKERLDATPDHDQPE